MKAKKRGSRGRFLILAGLICLLCCCALVLYNIWDSSRAGQASTDISARLESDIQSDDGQDLERIDGMPVRMIDGYACIGEIEIPDLSLRLPVLADWDYDRLKISPCRYSGSYLKDDMVICGHNYFKHFAPIVRLGIGQEVDFIAADGSVYRYQVCNAQTVQPTSVEQMVENDKNASGKGVENRWDLTLFTCNLGGQTRHAVRCIRYDPQP